MLGNSAKVIGMDIWRLPCSMSVFLKTVRKHNWCVYEISKKDDVLCFCSPISQRIEIQRTFEQIEYVKTTGMVGFLLRQLRRPRRLLCLLVSFILWYGLSHTIFEVTIQGDGQESKDKIHQTLIEMGYETPFYDQDMQGMKAKVKKQLENEIAWMEVSKSGSQYHIQFTTKEFATIEQLTRNELVAQKDGVIAKFELLHGNKMVMLNTFVHQGDVLVSNVLADSKNVNQDIYVKGKVFAYTWKDVHVEMEANPLPQPFQFYQLLFEARREASKDLRSGETIHKENILQFQDNTGTISMDVHYTLYEDITTPK